MTTLELISPDANIDAERAYQRDRCRAWRDNAAVLASAIDYLERHQ